MYEAKTASGSVLAPALIKEMLSVEKTFFTDKKFATFCVADLANISQCSSESTQSVVNLFYNISISRDVNNQTVYSATPIVDASTGAPYVDTQVGIDTRLAVVLADNVTFPGSTLYFDTAFSADNLKATFVQSFYFLGMPLAGYSNPADRSLEQRVDGDAFIVDVSATLRERFGLKETLFESAFMTNAMAHTADGSMKLYWWSNPMQSEEWEMLTIKDLNWAMLSFISVGIYVAYHTGSIVISVNSMFMTTLSIFVAFFFFRVIFQIAFFQFINFLIIFAVLGIGADDVFVFMDAFHQSLDELRAEGKPATLPHRVSHTMRRALHAIFVTSFTTSAAFMATALSPLMPLRSFGIFSALVIITVFCVNAAVMPPLTVMYARNLMGRSWIESFKAFSCGLFPIAPYVDPGLELPVKELAAPKAIDVDAAATADAIALSKYNPATMRRTERFFYVHYFKFLKGPAKYVILVCFTALFTTGVYLWVNLEVPSEPEQWFPESHMFQQYQELGSLKVMKGGDSASTLPVNILWGIDGVDDTGTDSWIPSDLGTVKFDGGFDPSAAKAQAWLMQTYEKLKRAPCTAKACGFGLLVDPTASVKNILAETDASGNVTGGFYLWLRAQASTGAYAAAHPVTNPVTGDVFNAKMCTYSRLEVAKLRYPSHVGYMTNDCDQTPAPKPRFILIEAMSSIRQPVAPANFVAVQEQWEAFSDASNRGAPSTFSGAAVTSNNFNWLWSLTSIRLRDDVYLGIAVCFPMVFVVLTLSTGNLVLALYSTGTIAGIVTTVIGIGAGGIRQWDLGTTEAIASVIVIGFSVDYCVHLANAYIENDATGRETRTRIAMTTMGISVTAGAVTTIIAGSFLGLCILTFFTKFCFLICWTIVSAYLWAVVFFCALCMTFGPSGNFGDITWIYTKVWFLARTLDSRAHSAARPSPQTK
jgi:hypothetical protein